MATAAQSESSYVMHQDDTASHIMFIIFGFMNSVSRLGIPAHFAFFVFDFVFYVLFFGQPFFQEHSRWNAANVLATGQGTAGCTVNPYWLRFQRSLLPLPLDSKVQSIDLLPALLPTSYLVRLPSREPFSTLSIMREHLCTLRKVRSKI